MENKTNRSMPVKDAMTVNVHTLDTSTNVTEVAKVMVNEGIGSVIVMEEDKPVGIICERDLLEKVISSDVKPSNMAAKDIMADDLITTDPATDLLDAMRTMVKNDIGHLPVVEGEKLTGIVTVQDLLEVVPQLLEIIPEYEEIEEPEEEIEESVCEICGEARRPLARYKNRWICEECRDFLVG